MPVLVEDAAEAVASADVKPDGGARLGPSATYGKDWLPGVHTLRRDRSVTHRQAFPADYSVRPF
jgi:hypothetical protein